LHDVDRFELNWRLPQDPLSEADANDERFLPDQDHSVKLIKNKKSFFFMNDYF